MPDFKHGLDYMLDSNDLERRSAISRLDLIGNFDENAFKKEFEGAFPELAAKLDYVVVACDFSLNKSKPFLYLTMGIELKETGAETYNQKIGKWLDHIYEEKRREAQESVVKKLAKDNGFDGKTRILDTNEFEKFTSDGSVQKIKIGVSYGPSEEDETLGLDLKKIGIGSYKVDTYYLDKKFYFSVERSIVPESTLQKVIKIIFWVPKKIFDLVRGLIYGKKSDKERHVITSSSQTVNKTKFGFKKNVYYERQPKIEKNKTDKVI